MTSSFASERIVLFPLPAKSIQYVKQESFIEAAATLKEQSRTLIANGDIEDRKNAGLVQVMVTICLERAGSVDSYAQWAEGIRYFLEAQSSWEEVQKGLRRKLTEINRELQHTPAAPLIRGPDSLEEDWLELNTLLGLTEFKGPTPGLKQPPGNAPVVIRTTEVKERYIPRPPDTESPQKTRPVDKRTPTIPRGLSQGVGQ